jgi:hypothetical protein
MARPIKAPTDFRRESEKMSRYLLEVVIFSSFAGISQETIEYIGGWHSAFLCAVSYFRAWLLPPITEFTN